MSDNLSISIIIPVYNIEKYLTQRLNNIIEQSFENFEIILINDGSSDGSEYICDKFALEYEFISVISQENQGASTAQNNGLKLAKGKYVWFVDGDDFITYNALTIIDSLLSKYNDNLDVLGFSFNRINKNIHSLPSIKKEILEPVDGGTFLKYYERVALWTFLYRRAVIIENDINFKTDIKIYEDNLFNVEVFNVSKKIIQTNYHLYNYRIERDGSIMFEKDLIKTANSLMLILKHLDSIELVSMSKNTLGKIKTSFWSSFLYNFDDLKKSIDKNKVILFSKELYLYTQKLSINWHDEIDIKIDVLLNNFFKKKYLCYRYFF